MPTSSRFEQTTRLDPREFSFPDRPAVSSTTAATSLRSSTFIAHLVEQLRSNYSRRDVATAGLSTLIGFTTLPDGRLANVRVLESSGSAEYDLAVLAAAGKTRVVELPAELIGKPYMVRFRALEAL
ncbi:MAG TPA: TonB family protein [Opitutaceae bacterium]|nr:TonB family protein [Opitutaceae bacterium]